MKKLVKKGIISGYLGSVFDGFWRKEVGYVLIILLIA